MRTFEQIQRKPVGLATVYPKLEINRKDDPKEKEADQMADRVMMMRDGEQGESSAVAAEEEKKVMTMRGEEELVKPMHDEEEKKVMTMQDESKGALVKPDDDEKKIMPKGEKGGMQAPEAVSDGIAASKGKGSALPADLQQDIGGKMGADFSQVNIHTDTKAADMNRQIGAKAFTYGKDIYFNNGQYNPSSETGKHLLAHELTHVVQQRNDTSSIQRQTLKSVADAGRAAGKLSGDPMHPKTTIVKDGEGPWQVAQRNNITMEQLARWNPSVFPNGLKSGTYMLKPGMQLLVSRPPSQNDQMAADYREYEKKLAEHLKNPKVILMMQGLSTVGNRLYGSGGDPERILHLTEKQKQADFHSSARKATGILMMEFFTGTGPERRIFDASCPITEEIKWSAQSNDFTWHVQHAWDKGQIQEGVQYQYYAAFSPDKTGLFKSLKAHVFDYYNATSAFYRGGMMYYYSITGNRLKVRVVDSYNVASGVTRDSKDNLTRIPGYDSPLGTTYVEFHYEYEWLGKR